MHAWKRLFCVHSAVTTSVATNPFNEEKLISRPTALNEKNIPPDSSGLSLINQATKIIYNARNVVVLTGAGISADSGIPTYRTMSSTSGSDGIWNRAGYFGMIFYGSWIGWMLRNSRAWQLYYEHYYQYSIKAKPNAGHYALCDLYNLKNNDGDFTVITQNVDSLHYKSGIPNDAIIEMHGNASNFKCNLCGSKQVNNLIVSNEINKDFCSPSCLRCKIGRARPNVIFFGERLKWQNVVNVFGIFGDLNEKDCVIVIGTSLQVNPVAQLPQIAIDNAVPIIEVNLDECVSKQYIGGKHRNVFLKGSASVILPQIIKLLSTFDSEW